MRDADRARGRFRRLAAVTVVVAPILATVGCAQPHPTLAELHKVPAVSLHPPGAVLVRRGGADSDRKNYGGVNPAVLTDLYATDDEPAAVLAYYRNHLGSQWVEDRNAGVRRPEWAQADAWESSRYLLQIGIASAAYRDRAATAIPAAAEKKTLFAVSLQARN